MGLGLRLQTGEGRLILCSRRFDTQRVLLPIQLSLSSSTLCAWKGFFFSFFFWKELSGCSNSCTVIEPVQEVLFFPGDLGSRLPATWRLVRNSITKGGKGREAERLALRRYMTQQRVAGGPGSLKTTVSLNPYKDDKMLETAT